MPVDPSKKFFIDRGEIRYYGATAAEAALAAITNRNGKFVPISGCSIGEDAARVEVAWLQSETVAQARQAQEIEETLPWYKKLIIRFLRRFI